MNELDDFLCQAQCEDFEPLIEEYCGIFSATYPLDYEGDIKYGKSL